MTTLAAGCGTTQPEPAAGPTVGMEIDPAIADTAIFAGGCFWCMEKPFEELEGVASVVSGFSGGHDPEPDLRRGREQADRPLRGRRGRSTIRPSSPTTRCFRSTGTTWTRWTAAASFATAGARTARPSSWAQPAERASAERTKSFLDGRFSAPIEVEVLDASPFYAAEEYHQDFYRTNAAHYQRYRTGCRRDARLEELWGDNAGHLGAAL